MRELFIYYRVRSANAARARTAVAALHADLRDAHPSLLARLLCRPEPIDDEQTWMESYATDPQREPAGIGAELQTEIESRARALLAPLTGPRHTEVFIACVS